MRRLLLGQLGPPSLRGIGGGDAKGRAETALGFPPKSRSAGWGLFPPDLHARVLGDAQGSVEFWLIQNVPEAGNDFPWGLRFVG
jgi:hypothetical protein